MKKYVVKCSCRFCGTWEEIEICAKNETDATDRLQDGKWIAGETGILDTDSVTES